MNKLEVKHKTFFWGGGRLNNKITVYGIWVADDSICSSTHYDSIDSMPVQRNDVKLATGQVRSR